MIKSNKITQLCINPVEPDPQPPTAGIAQEDGSRKEAWPLQQIEHEQPPRYPTTVALEDGVPLLRPARHTLARLLQHHGAVDGERGDA